MPLIYNILKPYVNHFLFALGVLLARPKSSSKSSSEHTTTYISQTTASMLKHAQFISCCLKALKALQEYWAR